MFGAPAERDGAQATVSATARFFATGNGIGRLREREALLSAREGLGVAYREAKLLLQLRQLVQVEQLQQRRLQALASQILQSLELLLLDEAAVEKRVAV